MRTAILTACLLAMLALSGCASDSEPEESNEEEQGMEETEGHEEVVEAPERFINFTANVTSGILPGHVGFDIDVFQISESNNETFNDFSIGNFTYEVNFGDGEVASGDGFDEYQFVEHTYTTEGTFIAIAILTFEDGGVAQAETTLDFVAPEPPRQLPEVSTWTLGPSLGCAGDVDTCIGIILVTNENTAMAPADATGIDGHWVQLGIDYWGLDLTSTITSALPDTDCNFYSETFEKVGSANNSDQGCEGSIPENTEWIYIYGYAQPSTEITMAVSLP